MLEAIVAYLLAKPVVGVCSNPAFAKEAGAYCDSSRLARCEIVDRKLNERMVSNERGQGYMQEYLALECNKFMPESLPK